MPHIRGSSSTSGRDLMAEMAEAILFYGCELLFRSLPEFLRWGQVTRGTTKSCSCLIFERVGKLLNHRIREHFAGNALDLCSYCFLLKIRLQRQQKVLALTDVFHAHIIHLFQSALNCFSLGIENRGLEGDVNVCLHRILRRLYGSPNDTLAE